MSSTDTSVVLDELHGYIRHQLAAGYLEPSEIARAACEVFATELDPVVLHFHATRYTREALSEHRAEQLSWPAVTDNERLDAAFAALERTGILCRQNFSCCTTCGTAEIWDEVVAVQHAGAPVLGYAFFHLQDTELAVDGGGLYLSYGAVGAGPAAAEAVGYAVVDALEAKGLTTVWDGDWSRRIFVQLEWRRRR